MNTDIEKQQGKNGNKNNPDKDKKKDGQFAKDDADMKKEADVEEPAEDSPLKGKDGNMDNKENDTSAPAGEKSGAKEGAKGLREWLSKSRVKWWIAVLVAIVLLTVVLVGTLLAVEDDDYDIVDNSVRLVKLWPRPNKPKNVINFVHGSLPDEGRIWPDLTKQLEQLLARYRNPLNRTGKVVECYGSSPIMQEDKVCKFNVAPIMVECSKDENFGYDKGKPCVFLEFNNITDWIPEPYTARELENYVDVSKLNAATSNLVYLDCQGDSLVDQENMGRIQYTPDRGFPIQFFPYRRQPEYMPPLVGIRFTNPAVGVAVSVTCKLWAKNINHTDEAVPSGQISFNLLVD
ncbi:sodium/potassium-transporting ATPase subunit beta-like [Stegodyphus dumicola]|uniref:sodium/potassium-transporting ATPase subunit beta-like n=1 Tax=Stegodyphus dumicola TaxID=202533 RepID=UPI0015ABCB2F|nr:sodium/potassium-transporting ATPase subunit beta-like [Stegodyphus dumicola]